MIPITYKTRLCSPPLVNNHDKLANSDCKEKSFDNSPKKSKSDVQLTTQLRYLRRQMSSKPINKQYHWPLNLFVSQMSVQVPDNVFEGLASDITIRGDGDLPLTSNSRFWNVTGLLDSTPEAFVDQPDSNIQSVRGHRKGSGYVDPGVSTFGLDGSTVATWSQDTWMVCAGSERLLIHIKDACRISHCLGEVGVAEQGLLRQPRPFSQVLRILHGPSETEGH